MGRCENIKELHDRGGCGVKVSRVPFLCMTAVLIGCSSPDPSPKPAQPVRPVARQTAAMQKPRDMPSLAEARKRQMEREVSALSARTGVSLEYESRGAAPEWWRSSSPEGGRFLDHKGHGTGSTLEAAYAQALKMALALATTSTAPGARSDVSRASYSRSESGTYSVWVLIRSPKPAASPPVPLPGN